MSELMVSVSGIRGIVGDSLTPDVILDYTRAFARLIRGGKVVLGRDSRVSGPMIASLITGALSSAGVDVIDLGIVPTPTVLLAIDDLKADGGIIVTASHNPKEWNALKLASSRGIFLNREESKKLQSILEKRDFPLMPWDKLGRISCDDNAVERHIDKICALVDEEQIRAQHFTVALDCVNGAGGVITPLLLKRLGCTVHTINEEPTGIFPRDPEPTPDHLGELEALVKKTKAHIGFAHDPDVDRLALVTDEGKAPGEEFTLALAVESVLEKKKGDVVCNYSTSSLTEEAARRNGARLFRAPVGEANVAQLIMERKAVIGGEGNGGVIYPALHVTRDAPLGIALILDLMARRKKSVSELVRSFPPYVMVKEKKSFSTLDERREAFKRLEGHEFADVRGIDTNDGLRLSFEEGWIHIRPSGTEPAMRVIGESLSKEWLEEKIRSMWKVME